MKKCRKLPEPLLLSEYRAALPNGTWEQMRDDPFHNGQQAYRDIKRSLVKGQRCLCSFCETRISNGTTDEALEATKHEQRVEHFHPKSDLTRPPNWALHWPNLWAVCLGGTKQDRDQQEDVIFPLPENLSCDAFKDRQISEGKLPAAPEGWLMAPGEVPAFPLVFQYAPDGTPEPHVENCAATVLPNNRYASTNLLVAKTIEHLNLGCSRLNRNRRITKARLEKRIERARQISPGVPADEVMLNLVRRLFLVDADSPWEEFFSLLRWRLGAPAEEHLEAIGFTG